MYIWKPEKILNKFNWMFLLGAAIFGVALVIPLGEQVVKEGDTVTIHYTITLEDGTLYDSTIGENPLKVTLGQGTLLPSFEGEVIGMHVRESKEFTLPPEKAYGQYRPDLVGTLNRSQLAENLEPEVGKEVQTEFHDGTPVRAVIISFTDTTVTLDANHPLAGQTLTFDVELMAIGNNTTPARTNQTMPGWLILTAVVAVAGFSFFKTRRLQLVVPAKSNRVRISRQKYSRRHASQH
jgi:FKBP-type peptidyl-prolyl cis-trans isomerase 2